MPERQDYPILREGPPTLALIGKRLAEDLADSGMSYAELGHSSVRTTLDVYSHVLPGLQEAAARSLETFLPPQLSEGNR